MDSGGFEDDKSNNISFSYCLLVRWDCFSRTFVCLGCSYPYTWRGIGVRIIFRGMMDF